MHSAELVVLMLVVPLAAMLFVAWGVRGAKALHAWHALRRFFVYAGRAGVQMTLTVDAMNLLGDFLIESEQRNRNAAMYLTFQPNTSEDRIFRFPFNATSTDAAEEPPR